MIIKVTSHQISGPMHQGRAPQARAGVLRWHIAWPGDQGMKSCFIINYNVNNYDSNSYDDDIIN
jgi:hypothetical protein